MIVSQSAGTVKKFRRTSWRFQQTIEKSGEAERLAGTIVTAHGAMEEATVTIDEVVFDTARLGELLPVSPTLQLGRDSAISACSPEQIQKLLVAAFDDGVDFICTPTPKPFVFYADHDDWITFYANTKSNLNLIVEPMERAGFKLVKNWAREW